MPSRRSCKCRKDRSPGYEVWTIDQSDTRPIGTGRVSTLGSGGVLYVLVDKGFTEDKYLAPVLALDLATLSEQAGVPVGTRPHMLFFNSTFTHAIVSYVSSGDVQFIDTATKQIVGAVRMQLASAHASVPTRDQTLVIVTEGKRLSRIHTNYATNTFTYNPAESLDLAPLENPDQPDNNIVCPVVTNNSRYAFVTLRGGGLYIVDIKSTPMTIVASYTKNEILPVGCGGIQVGNVMFINSGGGTPAKPDGFDAYAFDITQLLAFNSSERPPYVHFWHEDGFVDSHGAVVDFSDTFLWIADRAANRIRIFCADPPFRLIETIDMTKSGVGIDPTPDLLDATPDRKYIVTSQRGLFPLSANVIGHDNAVGNIPGVGVFVLKDGGASGDYSYWIPLSRIVNGRNVGDLHAIGVLNGRLSAQT